MRKVFMSDVRDAGMCSAGLRRFAKKHGLDLNDFLENGIDMDLLPQDDENVKIVKKRIQGESK